MDSDFHMISDLLSYCQKSGEVRRVRSTGGKQKGSIAGCEDRDGYIKICVKGRMLFAHRIAWLLFYGSWPDGIIDHRDGDKSNNRITNLRICDKSTNAKNSKIWCNNTSGKSGVTWSNSCSAWQAQIGHSGKQRHLGIHASFFDACAARISAENRLGYARAKKYRKSAQAREKR